MVILNQFEFSHQTKYKTKETFEFSTRKKLTFSTKLINRIFEKSFDCSGKDDISFDTRTSFERNHFAISFSITSQEKEQSKKTHRMPGAHIAPLSLRHNWWDASFWAQLSAAELRLLHAPKLVLDVNDAAERFKR